MNQALPYRPIILASNVETTTASHNHDFRFPTTIILLLSLASLYTANWFCVASDGPDPIASRLPLARSARFKLHILMPSCSE